MYSQPKKKIKRMCKGDVELRIALRRAIRESQMFVHTARWSKNEKVEREALVINVWMWDVGSLAREDVLTNSRLRISRRDEHVYVMRCD